MERMVVDIEAGGSGGADRDDSEEHQVLLSVATRSPGRGLDESGTLPALPPSPLRRLAACAAYVIAAVLASVVAKSLFSLFHFRLPFFLLAMQMAVTMTAVTLLRKYVPQHLPAPIPDVTTEAVRAVAPQSAVFVLNVVVGFLAMARVNIPLFLCLRRTTLFFVLCGEYFFLQKTHSLVVILCVSLMVTGAVIAGMDGLTAAGSEASLAAFGFVAVNNMLTTLYLVLTKRFTNSHPDVSSLGLVYLQSFVGLPMAATFSIMVGEVPDLLAFESWADPMFLAQLGIVCSLGICVCYTIVLVNTLNSPLVMSITGAVKDVVATAASMMLFAGFATTPSSITGLLLSMGGSTWYSLNRAFSKGDAAAGEAKHESGPTTGDGDSGSDQGSCGKWAGTAATAGAAPSTADSARLGHRYRNTTPVRV